MAEIQQEVSFVLRVSADELKTIMDALEQTYHTSGGTLDMKADALRLALTNLLAQREG